MVTVVGYPRSGNQLAAWVCRYLMDDKSIIHRHVWQTTAENFIQSNNSVIFCLRNYKECMVRHCWHRGIGLSEGVLTSFFGETMLDPNVNYAKLLRAFHSYSGPKFLNRYEDMIADSKKQALKLSWFLQAPRERTKSLIDDWDRQMTECISESRGATVKKYEPIEHSKQLTITMKEEWDRRMEEAVGKDIWDIYLRIYAEKAS